MSVSSNFTVTKVLTEEDLLTLDQKSIVMSTVLDIRHLNNDFLIQNLPLLADLLKSNNVIQIWLSKSQEGKFFELIKISKGRRCSCSVPGLRTMSLMVTYMA